MPEGEMATGARRGWDAGGAREGDRNEGERSI